MTSDRPSRNLADVYIPELPVPEDLGRTSPHIDCAEQQSLVWAWNVNFVRSQEDTERFMSQQWALVGARIAPEADAEGVVLGAEWMAWLGGIDNATEHAPESPARWDTISRGIRDTLKRIECNELVRSHSDPVNHAFDDLFLRTAWLGTSDWRARAIRCIRELLAGLEAEQGLKAARVIPDIATYTRLRRTVGYMPLVYCLHEIFIRSELDSPFREGTLYRELYETSIDAIDFINDLLTLNKELPRGEVSNIVLVLQHHKNISLDVAVQESLALVRSNVSRFRTAWEELQVELAAPEVDTERREIITRHVNGMWDYISGLLVWYRTSHRFLDASDRIGEPC